MLDISKLDEKFIPLAQQLITQMEEKGYKVLPYFGKRDLQTQARLYRRSRTTAVVNAAIQQLKQQQCDFLAQVLDEVGPQPTGAWATNALPGESYHQFGLALDCLLTPGQDSDYKVYADTASSLGLTPGYYFSSPDMDHVQLGKQDTPYGWNIKQINDYFAAHADK